MNVASIHFGPTTTKTDILVMIMSFCTEFCFVFLSNVVLANEFRLI